ncbi:DUF1707 domain-containing protein [Actinoallomurus vinaceus]|uniref:DUF1707 domain-containing protein n=1 Tax=Actinoallomurus vinaceus TaxID=1080074 RepID=A0ABP8UE26_9ACTN
MKHDDLRVGDAERDEVASALHEHFAQGRLTREELDERLSAALSAKTVGDLRKVTRDLPAGPDALSRPLAGPGLPDWRGPRRAGPPWAGPHWGGPPWARHAERMAHRGRHPRFGPPAGVFLIALFVIAFVTHGWFVFPLFAVVWFTMAFVGIRHARRWHRLTR